MSSTSSGTSRSALAGAFAGLILSVLHLGPSLISGRIPARGDLADFFWPMKGFTAARWVSGWGTGAFPLWNPLSGCGEPWLAQLQTGVFYPGDLPFLLPFPFAALAGIALHLIVAASGMAVWLEDLGTSRRAAFAGALVYAAGGAYISLFPVYNNACTAAFLPWMFFAARRAMRGGSVAGFAVLSALAFLAGEPALATAGMLSAAALAWITRAEGERVSRESSLHAASRLLAGIALAAGLAGVTLLPFTELLARSGRISGVTREEALAGAVGTGDLGDLVLPPKGEATRRPQPGRGGYLATLASSPLVLVLAAGCAAGFPGRRRFLALLGGLAALGLIISIGPSGFLMPALYDLGIVRGLRFPARWFVFSHLALAVMVGAGFDGWIFGRFRRREPDEEEPSDAGRSASLVAFAILLLVPALFLAALSSNAGTRDPLRALVVLVATAIGISLLAMLRRSRSVRQGWAANLLVLALALPLTLVARDPLDGVPARDLSSEPRILHAFPRDAGRTFSAAGDAELLAAFTQGSAPGWSEALPRRAHEALSGYTNLGYGIPLAGSPSPIPNRERIQMLGAALRGGDPARVLGLADVRRIVSPFPSTIPGARLTARIDGIYRYELSTSAGRIFFAREGIVANDQAAFDMIRSPSFRAEAAAFLVEPLETAPRSRGIPGFSVARMLVDEPERTEISAICSAPAVAVVTRSFDPGWRVTVDGVAVKSVRADIAFIGFVVPAGEHRIAMTYRPASFKIGAIVSIACLVVACGLAAAGRPVESM